MPTRGADFPSLLPAGMRRDAFRKSGTYLARIAVVLRDAPDRMLTFVQLMERLGLLVPEDRKSIENNIRVCLSTHSCFVKIPLAPDSLGKRNFWKLDLSHVTAKMVRRHFKGLLDFFPELSGRREEPAASVQIRCQLKFSGPFSIEALLRRDSPAWDLPRPQPLGGALVPQGLSHHRPHHHQQQQHHQHHQRQHLVYRSPPPDWEHHFGSPVQPRTAGGALPHDRTSKRLCVAVAEAPLLSSSSSISYYYVPY
ncbi:uncharacterized protein LOC144067308 [Stigmatopora argus]